MGQAKRRGTKDERISQAVERDIKHQKRARRFFHLCRFISPNATKESIISCGRNRGFETTDADGLITRKSQRINSFLPYIALASLFGNGYSLPKKGFR